MSVNKSLCVFAFVLCLYPGLSMALEGTETVSTYIEHFPEQLEGNQYQKDIVSAWKLIREEQYSKAFAIADELI
ncbi:hypothetical protein ONV78_25085 [Hahella sp. CR1]|uniref:hypothetical protein n=1 Tax=Hahella sp. CR1 TaxID=2992807 RepID=UPI002441B168|nr:hypothetical protein [Hahella sp. CR1]MDG9671040.1 hypothetical protein [Hahella sp. CR1]